MSEQLNGTGNAEKVLPGVEVEFGNPPEKHKLIFTLRALMEIHKATGKNPLNGELFANIGPADLATLVWAGTLHERHNMSVDDVAERIDFKDLNRIGEKIKEAYTQANPAKSEDAPEKKTEPALIDQPTG